MTPNGYDPVDSYEHSRIVNEEFARGKAQGFAEARAEYRREITEIIEWTEREVRGRPGMPLHGFAAMLVKRLRAEVER